MNVISTVKSYNNVSEFIDGEWAVKQTYSEAIGFDDGTEFEVTKVYEDFGDDVNKLNEDLQDKFLLELAELGGILLYEKQEFKDFLAKEDALGDGKN